MEAGISYIKSFYSNREATMLLAPPNFWYGWQFSIDHGYAFSTILALKRRFDQHRETLEGICFPLCHESHWFMVVLSFTDREIQYADGLKRSPLHNLVEKIKQIFREHFHVDISDWSDGLLRLPSPPQKDGDSCGILTLCHIESLYSRQPVEYSPDSKTVESLCLKWIDRCVQTHLTTMDAVQQELTQSEANAEYNLRVPP